MTKEESDNIEFGKKVETFFAKVGINAIVFSVVLVLAYILFLFLSNAS